MTMSPRELEDELRRSLAEEKAAKQTHIDQKKGGKR